MPTQQPETFPHLDTDQLQKRGAITAIVHLATQPPGVLQQVTLRPDKISQTGLIRLGDTPGDEARCWIHPQAVFMVEILGTATELEPNQWEVQPFTNNAEQIASAA